MMQAVWMLSELQKHVQKFSFIPIENDKYF